MEGHTDRQIIIYFSESKDSPASRWTLSSWGHQKWREGRRWLIKPGDPNPWYPGRHRSPYATRHLLPMSPPDSAGPDGEITILWIKMMQKNVSMLLVTSMLDYCNALLSSNPDKALNKLQLVLNTAARILIRTKKIDHITPVLASTLASC